jgi:hypothetical protein
MRRFMDPEYDMMLNHLEQLLSRPGRAKAGAVQESKHMLMRMSEELVHGRMPMDHLGPDYRHQIHMLRRRLETAHTSDEMRDLLRDFRQYAFLASSAMDVSDMRERIHELEGQIKTISEPPSTAAADSDEKVVTLEKLKDKRVLFTIMPFHEDFHDVWVGGIQRAATGTGLTPVRIDMITKSSEVTDDIVSAIEMAEIVIVDVTRNNPNVMFEFGFALAKGKPQVVISQSTDFLIFDIRNVRTLIYRNSWNGIEDLHKELQKFIKGTVGDKGKKK